MQVEDLIPVAYTVHFIVAVIVEFLLIKELASDWRDHKFKVSELFKIGGLFLLGLIPIVNMILLTLYIISYHCFDDGDKDMDWYNSQM
jgi:hypothetical protein